MGSKSHLRLGVDAATIDDVDDEPVIYRREVLTIMWLIGDLTFAVQRLLALAEGSDGSEEDDED